MRLVITLKSQLSSSDFVIKKMKDEGLCWRRLERERKRERYHVSRYDSIFRLQQPEHSKKYVMW